MKKLLFLLGIIATVCLGLNMKADAVTCLFPSGGGTGCPSGGSAGQALIVSSTNPLVFTFGNVSSSGGGGSSTLIFAGSFINVTASGTNGYIISNAGVTSTLGNWQGTWQGVNSSTFYLASNPNGYTNNTGTVTSISAGHDITLSPSPITTSGSVAVNTSSLYQDFSVANCLTLNTSTGQFGSTCITTSTNNFGGLTNASITAVAPITWSGTSVIGFNTLTPLTLGALYTFNSNVLVNGNVTTTNETVSSTLSLQTVTASGTTGYNITNDGNNFLNITQFGNTPGSGSTGTLQEYNIIEQNCPVGTSTTSGQGECTYSQSLTNPFGLTGRTFYDHTLELYPPTYIWGDFITATQSSTLPEYVVEFTDHTNNHAQPFTITPNNSSTNNGFAITLGNTNSTLGVTGNTTITGTESVTSNANVLGNLSVGTTTQNGNLYVSSVGTTVARINRGANTNYGLQVFSTNGTDDWNFGEKNDSTSNFYITDAANGGDVIKAQQNGTTTIGTSGTGTSVLIAKAFVASTTAQINQTTTIGTGSVNQFTVNPTTNKSYVEAGSSTIAATIGGALAYSATSTGNSAGASTTIETYTIPTSTFLAVGDEIDLYMGGMFANSVNTNKQVQVSVASTTIFDTGAAFAPANTACNWMLESRGMVNKAIPATNPATTTILWVSQWTDSCQNALTDDSGDAGNATVTATTTAPIVVNVYGNGTSANDTVANYFKVLYSPF